MSFPPTTGAGSTSHVPSRGFVLTAEQGEPFWWLGSLTTVKVDATATGGTMDIVDHQVPAGYAPPRHVHTGQDEVFYIIDGLFAVTCGDQHWQAGPGSLVFLPRGIPHGFTVGDEGPGRTLLINAPAGFAEVITELGTRADSLTLPGPEVRLPDAARISTVSAGHGIYPAPPE